MPKTTARVGTSGWNYSHWRDEVYPAGVKQREWLPYVASRMDAVEINSSFYRIPAKSSLEEWQQVTPARLRFAAKLWRGITHYRKLAHCEDFIARFFEVFDRLATRRRGPLLVQLPPNQKKDLPRLDTFLKQVRAASSHRWKVTVEFRDDSWLSLDVFKLLDKQHAAICLHDRMGAGAAQDPNDVGFVYVRRHGPKGGQYRGGYSPSELEQDARRVQRWLGEGKHVYFFFNNDIGGHAFRNAETLRGLLGKETSTKRAGLSG